MVTSSMLLTLGITLVLLIQLKCMPLLQALAVFIHAPFSTSVFRRDPDGKKLTPLQNIALNELTALNFLPLFPVIQEGATITSGLFLRHAEKPIFALLSFAPYYPTSYPVAFISIENQTPAITLNRVEQLPVFPNGTLVLGDFPDLASHLRAHEQRFLSAETVAPEEAFERLSQAYAHLYAHHIDRGNLVVEGKQTFLNLRAALDLSRQFLSIWKSTEQAPYQSPLLNTPNREAYYAECYQAAQQDISLRASRFHIWWRILVANYALSFLALSLFDWRCAIGLLLTQFLITTVTSTTMRAVGYSNLLYFPIPLCGSFVTGQGDTLAAWKHAVVCLSTYLPGLIISIICLTQFSEWATNTSLGLAIVPALFYTSLLYLIFMGSSSYGSLIDLIVANSSSLLRGTYLVIGIGIVVYCSIFTDPFSFFIIILPMVLIIRHDRTASRLLSPAIITQDTSERLSTLFARAAHAARTPSFLTQYSLVDRARHFSSPYQLSTRQRLGFGIILLLAYLSAVFTESHLRNYYTSCQTFDTDFATYYGTRTEKIRESLLAKLEEDAASLPPNDARQSSLQFLKAMRLPPEDKYTAFMTLFRTKTYPLGFTADYFATMIINARIASLEGPTRTMASDLKKTIDELEAIAPQIRQGTLHGRQVYAHLIDINGDHDAAEQSLLELNDKIKEPFYRISYRGLQLATEALAWFHIDHNNASKARDVLDTSLLEKIPFLSPEGFYAIYGWSHILSGQYEQGITELQQANQASIHASSKEEIKDGAYTLDLLWAYRQSGAYEAVKQLFISAHLQSLCDTEDISPYLTKEILWQKERKQALSTALQETCAEYPDSAL